MAAELPSVKPDVLIVEATYGTNIHEKREEREARFTGEKTDRHGPEARLLMLLKNGGATVFIV